MNDTQPIIRLEGVNKTYGIEDTLVKALDEVNLTISEGEYCAIMGPSGSGKSSAMNIIGCLDRPTSGHYYLDKLDVSTAPDADLAKIRNRKLGFIFQQFHLLPQLNALENVMLPMIYGGMGASERKERAVPCTGAGGTEQSDGQIAPTSSRGDNSSGWRSPGRLWCEPRLLLADEPTGALDSRTTQEVMDIFTQLNESGITIVMVTHEPDVAKQTRRIVWFKDGQVIHSHLTPADIYQVAMAG